MFFTQLALSVEQLSLAKKNLVLEYSFSNFEIKANSQPLPITYTISSLFLADLKICFVYFLK